MLSSPKPDIKLSLLRIAIILFSIFVTIYIINSTQFKESLNQTKNLAYFGAFTSGIFFTSTFTVAPATVILFILGKKHNFILISIFGALGAMVGDNLLLKFIKSELEKNMYAFIIPKKTRSIKKILHTRSFYWFLATIGILIIASPLPDELGISILSLIHFKTKNLLAISFLVNFLGILLITSIGAMR